MFLSAQDRVWSAVVSEISAGQKTSHWIWYVFPQLASLGRSERARIYGIADLAEAVAYLDHPILKVRLVKVAGLMVQHAGTPAETILGTVDAMKLRSSMTLFSAVPDAPKVFSQVLETFFAGERCADTDTSL